MRRLLWLAPAGVLRLCAQLGLLHSGLRLEVQRLLVPWIRSGRVPLASLAAARLRWPRAWCFMERPRQRSQRPEQQQRLGEEAGAGPKTDFAEVGALASPIASGRNRPVLGAVKGPLRRLRRP